MTSYKSIRKREYSRKVNSLNSDFTKQHVQMAKRFMKRWLTLLVNKEMQIEAK